MTNALYKIEKNDSQTYLYIIKSLREYKELCAMEMKSIFNGPVLEKFHLTTMNIPLTRSGFFQSKITILYEAPTVAELETKLQKDNLYVDQYKIHFIKLDPVDYNIQLTTMRTLGFAIEGDFSLTNPKVEFAVTQVKGTWVFGYFEKNSHLWKTRKDKPYNYSNALDIILAKALVNIAIQNDFNTKIVDPCCGIGTVIIEARAMHIEITGFEINPFIKMNCNINLEHFGYAPDVKLLDMHRITNAFDVTILDMPYGQFSSTTKEIQIQLIQKSMAISTRLILVAMDEMTEELHQLGFTILDSCRIKKSNVFSRYVYECTL